MSVGASWSLGHFACPHGGGSTPFRARHKVSGRFIGCRTPTSRWPKALASRDVFRPRHAARGRFGIVGVSQDFRPHSKMRLNG